MDCTSRTRAALLVLIAAGATGPAAAQLPTPTFTSTAVPTLTRSATATFTSTRVPSTPTGTATFTSTSVPPTPTQMFTSTSVPSTPTRTAIFTPTIPPGLSIDDVSILEGDAGTRSAVFVVRVLGPRTYPVKVSAKTVDGTALGGSDYDASSASLVFNAPENQKTFSVTVRGDRTLEPDETFTVRLGNAVGAPLGDPVGIGTILNDDGLRVGVPELSPANPTTAPGELTKLTLRWTHPERWRALNTVDLRLVDGDQPVFWARFDEAANTLASCDPDNGCGVGLPPGTGAPIESDTATFYPAESAVQGSGPTGLTVDLIFAFSLDQSLSGHVLRVETAATEDSGEEQGFLPIAYLEVIAASPSPGTADDDGCAIVPARTGGNHHGAGPLALGLLALAALRATRAGQGRRPPSRAHASPPRRWLALLGLGLALSALSPVAAQAQRFCLKQSDCEDGLFCTDDVCIGVCIRTTRSCDDFNGCTTDRCSEGANRCVNAVDVGKPCEDFNPFTDDDHCDEQGQCGGGFCTRCGDPCDADVDCPTGLVCSPGGVCLDSGVLQTPLPTRTPTRTRTPAATSTRTRVRTPIATLTRTGTATRTVAPSPSATQALVSTPTPTASARVTATAPSAIPTVTPTPSPPPAGQCAGDCDGDAAVGVNELVRGVNIALDSLLLAACPQFDIDGSGEVEVAEIIAAVRAALLGCE